ncbi:MAG TPA: Ku protein [Candidatus Binataceae bacterium]
MAARSIANANISFGLVSIPVQLYTATASKSVRFHQLHAKDKSRINYKIYCPKDDAIIDRSELVKGFEVEKGQFVIFTEEELDALEARDDHSIEISEFVPLASVDPVYFETSYHLGCEGASARAYKLLADAMESTERVALAHFTMRGKEHLVLVRPYEKGLMMHTIYYADELRRISDVDRAASVEVKQTELDLAKRLIDELTHENFDPVKYHDNYRERVIEAANRKVAGREVTEAAPEAKKAQVIDLMSALKASLEKRGAKHGASEAEEKSEGEKPATRTKSGARSTVTGREKRSATAKR